MPFTKYGSANLAQGQLQGGVSASSPSGILQSGQGDLFPTNAECPFWAKVEKFDTALNGYRVLKREIVKVTGRSGDALTWTRGAGFCPFAYNSTTQTNTPAAFDAGDTITQIFTAEQIKEIQDGKLSLESYQNQSPVYAADVGTANTYSIALTPAPTAYAAGQRFSFKSLNANTGTSTLNVNGLGAKTIKKKGGTADLSSGDISAGQIVDVVYDGTNFEMQTPVPPSIPSEDFVLWEWVAAWDALTLEYIQTSTGTDSQISFWNATATQKISVRVIGNGNIMSTIIAGLKKVGAPADNCIIAIQADSAGAPSGTDLATATIAGGTITTTSAEYNPSLSGSVTPTDRTYYWVELRRSWALDAANYYQLAVHTDDTISFPYKINNAGAYGSNLLTETHSVKWSGFYPFVAVRSKANITKLSKVKLYSPSALSALASVSKTISGIYTGFSSLKIGAPYFISDTAGAISLTAGTNKIIAGIAKTASSIIIQEESNLPVYIYNSGPNTSQTTAPYFFPGGNIILRVYGNSPAAGGAWSSSGNIEINVNGTWISALSDSRWYNGGTYDSRMSIKLPPCHIRYTSYGDANYTCGAQIFF